MCLFAEQGIREVEELEKVRKGKGIYREELDGLWGNGFCEGSRSEHTID